MVLDLLPWPCEVKTCKMIKFKRWWNAQMRRDFFNQWGFFVVSIKSKIKFEVIGDDWSIVSYLMDIKEQSSGIFIIFISFITYCEVKTRSVGIFFRCWSKFDKMRLLRNGVTLGPWKSSFVCNQWLRNFFSLKNCHWPLHCEM